MAPFPLEALFGKGVMYAIYLLIGVAFGWVLEIAGFGDSRRLAAQFYFRDQTVLKVMFTAIVVAMLLVFWASAVGLLDYDELMVKETWLWPGIAGGFIMGVGFILGGSCPGTSLVSVATLKIAGMFFLLGHIVGVLIFGESVPYIHEFWNSSYLGLFTLPDLFGLETGVVVLLVVCLALAMFLGFGWIQRLIYGRGDTK